MGEFIDICMERIQGEQIKICTENIIYNKNPANKEKVYEYLDYIEPPQCKNLIISTARINKIDGVEVVNDKIITLSKELNLKYYNIISKEDKKDIIKYRLQGFICYEGKNNGGHYVYYKSLSPDTNNDDDKWVKLNDTDKENNGTIVNQSTLPNNTGVLYYYTRVEKLPKEKVNVKDIQQQAANTIELPHVAAAPEPASVIKNDEPNFVFEDLGKLTYTQNNTKVEDYKSDLLSKYNETKITQKHFILLVGKPGAGKSYFIQNHLKEKFGLDVGNFIILNPDDLRYYNPDFINEISGYLTKKNTDKGKKYTVNGKEILCYTNENGAIVANTNATLNTLRLVRESMQNNIIPFFLQSNKNIIYDSACQDSNFCGNLLKDFSNNGYLVSMICVDAPDDVAFARAKERQKRDGRYMADDYLNDFYSKFNIQINKTNIIKNSTIPEKNFYKIIDYATETPFKYSFDKRNPKEHTPIYNNSDIPYYLNSTKDKAAKFMASLNAGNQNLQVGLSYINNAFNSVIANIPIGGVSDSNLSSKSAHMHMLFNNYLKTKNLYIPDSFYKNENLQTNNYFKEMYLYISEKTLEDFKYSNDIYPGDVFIDILQDKEWINGGKINTINNMANKANKAMIYCVGPDGTNHNINNPTNDIIKNKFLQAMLIVGKNIANAINEYNKYKGNENKKIDYVRICLISGNAFLPAQMKIDGEEVKVAEELIKGIHSVNKEKGVKDIVYNFAYADGVFQTAFDKLKNQDTELQSTELIIHN